MDAVYFEKFWEEVEKHFENKYPGVNIIISSYGKVYTQSFAATIQTVARSYTTALVTTTLIMLLLLGLRYGLLSMIPNLFPIIFALGLIGWLDFPLNISTLMVACIVIGIAVDDTIHFIHSYRKYYSKIQDSAQAIQATLQTTGRAIVTTTIVLSIGFFTFTLATLNNFKQFGLLSSIAILMALIADLFITPALLILMHNIKVRRTRKKINLNMTTTV